MLFTGWIIGKSFVIPFSDYRLRSTKERFDKDIVNFTPVRVAHSSRKGAKKILNYWVNLGVFAALRETRF